MFGSFRSAAQAYAQVDLETKVATSDPHGLIQLLYDGAIVAVGQAQACLASGDVAGKGRATSRAVRIIEEGLRASLDPSQGGELAGQLDGLYAYMAQRLLLASVRNDADIFAEVKKLLAELRDAWAGIRPETAAKPAPKLAPKAGPAAGLPAPLLRVPTAG